MAEILVIHAESVAPWYNLAVEEYLLDSVTEYQFILYLWQNRNTVVIGKHQNPWKECRTRLLEAEGGCLSRRISGGGAVYHDLGNLNFTFVMSRNAYNLEKQLDIILKAVRNLGIPSGKNSRNDLTVNGGKFSGNAFCFRRKSVYHHGTILVSCDLEKMAKYLEPSPENIRSKGIESVRSQVANLSEYYPGLTVNRMKQELIREFTKAYTEAGSDAAPLMRSSGSLDQAVIRQLECKYASWEWRYGEAPKFDLEISTHFSWGEIGIGLKLEKGIIREATVYADAIDAAFIGTLAEALKGTAFQGPKMAECIRHLNPDHTDQTGRSMQDDIANWLLMKDF